MRLGLLAQHNQPALGVLCKRMVFVARTYKAPATKKRAPLRLRSSRCLVKYMPMQERNCPVNLSEMTVIFHRNAGRILHYEELPNLVDQKTTKKTKERSKG